jgi:hypothetical protein
VLTRIPQAVQKGLIARSRDLEMLRAQICIRVETANVL